MRGPLDVRRGHSIGQKSRGGDRGELLANVAIGAVPLAVGACSSYFTRDGIRSWYRTIERPAWNPPDRVFGAVWTGLYAMMGAALVEIVRSDRTTMTRRVGLGLFAVQLVLNFGWSWIFFVNHDLRGAMIEIIALWLAIAATIAAFAATRRSAGLLLVPYLAWVSFATVLTGTIWRMNR